MHEPDLATRAGERGLTLVEVSIVAFLTSIILGIFYGSSASVGKLTIESNRAAESRSRQIDVLKFIRSELSQTGLDNRFTVAVDGRSITYQKLIGASSSGGGLAGMWSPSYTIQHDNSGTVHLRGSGRTISLGSKVKSLRFSHNPSDSFISVTCTTNQNGRDVTRTVHVHARR